VSVQPRRPLGLSSALRPEGCTRFGVNQGWLVQLLGYALIAITSNVYAHLVRTVGSDAVPLR
jgi:hypothetical protein